MFNDANGKYNPKYTGNYRKTQPRNNRQVTYFDADSSGCGKPAERKKNEAGHFEKYDAKLYDLFYLEG